MPGEREAVLGDLAESDAGTAESALAIAGLIIRRQALLWKTWQPWVALLGIVCLAGMLQSEIIGRLTNGIFLQVRTYLRHGVHYGTGLTPSQDIVYFTCLFLAMCLWTWTSAFVLARLSGRAIWLLTPLYLLVCLDSFPARLFLSGAVNFKNLPNPLILLLRPLSGYQYDLALLLIPTVWGIRLGRKLTLRLLPAGFLAAASTCLTLFVIWADSWHRGVMERWSEGVLRAGPSSADYNLLLLCWPAFYMLWMAARPHQRSKWLA
jgi:hypothetical protein